jgi:hypothetical protein
MTESFTSHERNNSISRKFISGELETKDPHEGLICRFKGVSQLLDGGNNCDL